MMLIVKWQTLIINQEFKISVKNLKQVTKFGSMRVP